MHEFPVTASFGRFTVPAIPPSISKVCPVTWLARSEARNRIGAAISDGAAGAPSGMSLRDLAPLRFAEHHVQPRRAHEARRHGVDAYLGGPSSWPMPATSWISAAFAVP